MYSMQNHFLNMMFTIHQLICVKSADFCLLGIEITVEPASSINTDNSDPNRVLDCLRLIFRS